MGADQGELLLGGGVGDGGHQAGVEIGEGLRVGGALDHPRAVLEQFAISGDELGARHDVLPSIETWAETIFQPSAKRTHAWLWRPRLSEPSRKNSALAVAKSRP